jgi:SAM-dependent methyltransferase
VTDAFAAWLDGLARRHLADLSFAEVRRAAQALSSAYVERRDRLAAKGALDSAGKRAAFALYFAPLHFLFVRAVVAALGAARPSPSTVLDLGCGTGAAGAAWAGEAGGRPAVEGVERSGWAVEEARATLRALGLRGAARRGDLLRARPARRGEAVVVAYTANELGAEARGRLLERLRADARAGARVLVVEPLARGAAPWWDAWAAAFTAEGGRADEWRFPAALPELLARFDRATGLDHRELRGRSLWLPSGPRGAALRRRRGPPGRAPWPAPAPRR